MPTTSSPLKNLVLDITTTMPLWDPHKPGATQLIARMLDSLGKTEGFSVPSPVMTPSLPRQPTASVKDLHEAIWFCSNRSCNPLSQRRYRVHSPPLRFPCFLLSSI
ncbi:hypothetical protein KIF59_13480 [Enterobacter cloacae subsp. cloacae]|nr:hypothetical protein [Enterobacter cloacae subsp. cloacae]